MSKNLLQLLINIDKIPNENPGYKCDYKFNRYNFCIMLYKGGVRVDWIGGKADACSGLEHRYEFKDAIRKAYLLYMLYYGKSLSITKFTVLLNGKKERVIRSKDSKEFPFVVSVINDTIVSPYEKGKDRIFKNKEIMNYLAKSKRSNDQDDKKIVALLVYLQSKSRWYEIDRFLNLWTSINSIYSGIDQEHTKWVKEQIELIPDDVLAKYDLNKLMVSRYYTFRANNDNDPKRLLIKLVQKRMGMGKSKGCRDKESQLKEFSKTYIDYCTPFADQKLRSDGRTIYSAERLYSAAVSGNFSDGSVHEDECYRSLCDWSGKIGASLFSFLTFELPYYFRCNNIHGNEAALIISGSYYTNLFACMNYFMERFLSEYIPYMFDENEMDKIIREYHDLLCAERPGSQEILYKKDDTEIKSNEVSKLLKKMKNSQEFSKEDWMKQIKTTVLL